MQYKLNHNTIHMPQTAISFRVDNDLKRSFDSLCDAFGLSNTAALTIFMKAVVRERKIPFEIKIDTPDDTRVKAMKAFERMREDAAAAGLQDMSLEEINAIIKETRDARKTNAGSN